jgi:hypothetical protein
MAIEVRFVEGEEVQGLGEASADAWHTLAATASDGGGAGLEPTVFRTQWEAGSEVEGECVVGGALPGAISAPDASGAFAASHVAANAGPRMCAAVLGGGEAVGVAVLVGGGLALARVPLTEDAAEGACWGRSVVLPGGAGVCGEAAAWSAPVAGAAGEEVASGERVLVIGDSGGSVHFLLSDGSSLLSQRVFTAPSTGFRGAPELFAAVCLSNPPALLADDHEALLLLTTHGSGFLVRRMRLADVRTALQPHPRGALGRLAPRSRWLLVDPRALG